MGHSNYLSKVMEKINNQKNEVNLKSQIKRIVFLCFAVYASLNLQAQQVEIIVQCVNGVERSDTIEYINVIAEKNKPVSVDNPKLVSLKDFSNAKSKQDISAYNTKDATSEKFDKVVFGKPGYYNYDGRWVEDDMSGFITELEVRVNGQNVEPVKARVKAFDEIEGGYVLDAQEDPDMLWHILALSKSAKNDNAFLVKIVNVETKYAK